MSVRRRRRFWWLSQQVSLSSWYQIFYFIMLHLFLQVCIYVQGTFVPWRGQMEKLTVLLVKLLKLINNKWIVKKGITTSTHSWFFICSFSICLISKQFSTVPYLLGRLSIQKRRSRFPARQNLEVFRAAMMPKIRSSSLGRLAYSSAQHGVHLTSESQVRCSWFSAHTTRLVERNWKKSIKLLDNVGGSIFVLNLVQWVGDLCVSLVCPKNVLEHGKLMFLTFSTHLFNSETAALGEVSGDDY